MEKGEAELCISGSHCFEGGEGGKGDFVELLFEPANDYFVQPLVTDSYSLNETAANMQ